MSEAYKWLQTLPASLREEVKSMEQMVSMYLRAKRLGGALPTKEELSEPENSKSSQEFHKTLKTLKHELEQFDFAGSATNTAPASSTTGTVPETLRPLPDHPQQAGPAHGQGQGHQAAPSAALSAAGQALAALRLDPRSRQIVNEIRESLNLSSDMEVIRMSLVLAHRALRDLLK